MNGHCSFRTCAEGLRRDLPPMVLFEKAKKLGIWNPSDIDFTQDVCDWHRLSGPQQDMLLRLTALFVAGEEAVTADLLPLIQVIAAQGHVEEELFLTAFLWEEAKHVDFFSRFLAEVCGQPLNLQRYHGRHYTALICRTLPEALGALNATPTSPALVRASCVYNMVVEGMLAETGYHAYFTIMDQYNVLPGQRRGIVKLKQDESRHIAYGVYLLSRLISVEPELYGVVESTMAELLPAGLGVVEEVFDAYDPVPFAIDKNDFLAYAAAQFQKRLERIRRARDLGMQEICDETTAIIDADDA